ncbi:MAG: glycosyltransferase family 4 protein [Candidatus Omnitrophica bacterium]|nr:glycosyltransferase family 4 protein [Candidatus Omnitrophota bacterium]MBU4487483.1 glycosyltransferase family 4 protein [Candidatus Omnitrophota bacterium]MCG2705129.1 glycosyltransferase family 4 protein [Candidatus Omnitrophota bacterium]
MKPINVLVVSSKYPPEYAGSGIRARTTYKRLAEKFPIAFEVLTSSVTYNKSAIYDIDGVRVTRIARKPFPLATDEKRGAITFTNKLKLGCDYLSEAVLTWKYLASNSKRFDLIHIFGKNWVTAATVTFAKAFKKPFIVELCNEVDTPHHYEPFFLRAILGGRFPGKTPIVCISDMLKNMCESYGYKDSIWCRPNPVDESRFFVDEKNKAAFRKKYTHFGPDDILLVYVAKFRPSKNQILLLDVLRELPEKFKLVLAGPVVDSGPLFERDKNCLGKIKEKIRKYGLESRVELKSEFIENVDKYLKMSDIYLFPTTTEALGTPMLEAMACGLPVVANRIKGVTDSWIEDGKNGYISSLNAGEFAEKIQRALAITPGILSKKRQEILSQCSARVLDEHYFSLLKELAG